MGYADRTLVLRRDGPTGRHSAILHRGDTGIDVTTIIGICILVVVIIVLFIGAEKTNVTNLTTKWVSFTRADRGVPRRVQQDSAALDQLYGLTRGLPALIDADGSIESEVLHRWLDLLCEGLALALGRATTDQFRVAVWTNDEPDGPDLNLVASCLFNKNDPTRVRLNRQRSIAGKALVLGQPKYMKDRRTDPDYDRLDDPMPKPYLAIYAAPLGREGSFWGVMTADSREADGFGFDEQSLVDRFAEVCSVGAIVSVSRRDMTGEPLVVPALGRRRPPASTGAVLLVGPEPSAYTAAILPRGDDKEELE